MVVCCVSRHGPGGAKARNTQINQSLIGGAQSFRAQPQLIHYTRAIIMQQYIGVSGEAHYGVATSLRFQINGE